MSQTTPEQATSIHELFAPALQTPEASETANATGPYNSTDRANLITELYTDFEIFTPETAEKAPELLIPQIEKLAQEQANKNPGTAIDPFVVVNLTEDYDRDDLTNAFNQGQSEGNQTWVYDELWDQYDLSDINERTIDGTEPLAGDVRAQILTVPENSLGEPGLQATSKSLKDQIKFAKGKTLLNLTDYILLQAMRREEDRPLMDIPTFTRFVQLDTKAVGGDSVVGLAGVRGSQLSLNGGSELADVCSGVRLSVGPEEA